MKFTYGNLTAVHAGGTVELARFEKLDVTLVGAGRIHVEGVEKGGSRAMQADCVLEAGGVRITSKCISLACERADPPDGGPPVRNVIFSFWNEV